MTPESSNATAPARLRLCERSEISDSVDGVWWPHSADLKYELPDLIAVCGLRIGPVRRVVYDPSRWRSAPSRIIKGPNVIRVDPYRMVASDTIYLLGTHARDAVLFVVPPASRVRVAARVLQAADGRVGVAALRTLMLESPSGDIAQR